MSALSRRVLWLFAGVMALIVAELSWWITFHVRTSHEQAHERLLFYEIQEKLAADMIIMGTRGQTPSDAIAQTILTQHFPDLQWRAGDFANAELAALYPHMGPYVREDVIATLEHRDAAHVRMFVSEGGFFMAMLLVGGALVLRTMRHDVRLIRQQANFLAAVTHELKSPLASIRLYTETMQLRDPPQATRTRYLSAMHADVERLESLVANLLAVARLEAGKFVMHPEVLDVVRETATIVKALEKELLDRFVPVEMHLPRQSLMVNFDALALQTVLRNLLDNAAKYSGGANKPVQVRVFAEGGQAVVQVEDQGIGIAASEIGKIFRKFYRVGDEMVRQTEGSGLGLYLVEQLVTQSGGKVTAQSPGTGFGTVLRVSLPLNKSVQETT